VDSLMEDEDFSRHVTRQEFETMIDGFMRDFTLCLKQALGKSGLSCDHIEFVELVGEATRIPII
jgi:molecular chaperone DnaK (HSP70)